MNGISISIPAGQTVAFVGPSGGGKTTLANLISRFFDPQSGTVRVGGVDVRDIPKEELMNTVSFVFQNSRLIKASIFENVRLGKPEATREEVMAALKMPSATISLKTAGWYGYGDRHQGGLSFRRRAAADCYCPRDAEKYPHHYSG